MGIKAALARAAQRSADVMRSALLSAGLFVVYFLGMGLTRALAVLFGGRTRASSFREDPAWRPAEGYDSDEESCLRQS